MRCYFRLQSQNRAGKGSNGLRKALRRRAVFVSPSWRYADPRAGLLAGAEWESTRSIVCRSLGLSPDPTPVLAALSSELDETYREVTTHPT